MDLPPPPPALGGVDEESIRGYLSYHKWPTGIIITHLIIIEPLVIYILQSQLKIEIYGFLMYLSGLMNALIKGLAITPARFFICDDSGSMMSSDGHQMVMSGSNYK